MNSQPTSRNPYAPPTAQVADRGGDASVNALQVESTARWPRFRRFALVFSAIGIAGGLLLAIAPFYFGTPTGTLASFIVPAVLGLLVAATHRLNFRRLRDPASSYPRVRLTTFNLLLLAFFVLGFVGEYQLGENFRHSPVMMAAFLFFGPLPFAANALYLCLPDAKAPRD